ncbi:MAG: helicase-related protein [Desulfomonilaceae bacterium]
MSEHIENRKKIINAVVEELMGPCPCGEEIDCSGVIRLKDKNQLYKSWRQMGSGEEIITREQPHIRYGIGVLYPIELTIRDAVPESKAEDDATMPGPAGLEFGETRKLPAALTEEGEKELLEIEKRITSVDAQSSSEKDDLEIALSNRFRPSSLAISFLGLLKPNTELYVQVNGGRYKPKEVSAGGTKNTWWLRSPVRLEVVFKLDKNLPRNRTKVEVYSTKSDNLDGLNISVELFSRFVAHQHPDSRLFTVCVINRTHAPSIHDEACLFQTRLSATIRNPKSCRNIQSYPRPELSFLDEEERSLDLLYRNVETFVVGHGCAGDWSAADSEGKVEWAHGTCLPIVEVPNVTPDVRLKDGSLLTIPMSTVAESGSNKHGWGSVNALIASYREWIAGLEKVLPTLKTRFVKTAEYHIGQCREFLTRMEKGLEFLNSNPQAMKAFCLANRAVLTQQLRSRKITRPPQYDSRKKRILFPEPFPDIDELHPPHGRGNWRPFQMAFLLACVRSVANESDPDRETVDLIWFPTGGGKTEAYLGLAAFAILLRRLRNPADAGVEVLMRYTLRLLTAQQFLRASTLICALEKLRRENPHILGDSEIAIGMWLGGETTPNTRDAAKTKLQRLKNLGDQDNPFMVEKCPWCGALMGPSDYQGRSSKAAPKVLGYDLVGNAVRFRCPDVSCDFADALPLYVVDEDLYDVRPSLVIGTVDKFARLSWKKEARTLFGLDNDGNQEFSPPGLIIQDELHLISGPLGSMVGLYETVVEHLCTKNDIGKPVKPKIVCSTATIRRSASQIRALFAREKSTLFPPPGLDVGDSFFARHATDEKGNLLPGRIYVGINSPSLSFDAALGQTMAALLEAPMSLPSEQRDPWWTLVSFFNTLRELGSALSLLQSHIPDHIRNIANRRYASLSEMRRIFYPKELTGRLRSNEIGAAISQLEAPYTDDKTRRAVDVCLTSSIMEVGVDIDRLSLMLVVGQPKSTSQYIQITGRIGRKWWERPGLVFTLYGSSKPRDRSHFEKFRTYHERLYAQVEPSSVTPFSPPTLERALHAIMAAFVLQKGSENEADSPYPFPYELVAEIEQIVSGRVSFVNEEERHSFKKIFERRKREWEYWERTKWTGDLGGEDVPMLRDAGGYVSPDLARISWPTPTSMRNVDAACQAEVFIHIGDGWEDENVAESD